MIRLVLPILLLAATAAQADHPHVWLDTDRGPIIIELDPAAAPVTVNNFLRYVDEGFFDGLIFHRVIPNFMIQGGGFTDQIAYREPDYDPIVNESGNGLLNQRGTVAMARTNEPDSATTQFFINLVDNDFLDGDYAVFGQVLYGMETVDDIAGVSTSTISTPYGNLANYPRNPPLIHRAVRSEGFPLMADHSGSWYDEDNAGVGFNIEIANNASGDGPMAIVYWYNFALGGQFWLTGQDTFEWGENEVTVDLYSAEAGSFQNAESDFEIYGDLTIRFSGCASGTVSYSLPGFGSGEIELTRLSRPASYKCTDS